MLDYIDGKLLHEEVVELEELLQHDKALQKRLALLRRTDSLLQKTFPERPSANFTEVVMQKLNSYSLEKRHSYRNGLLLLCGIVVTVGITSLLVSLGVFDQNTSINLNDLIVYKDYFKLSLPSITLSEKIIVDAIILLNLVLAFLVLDKTVLKPWFERRSRMNY